MSSETLDPRLNVYSPELADSRLQGQVDAERFVDGEPAMVQMSCLPLKPRPAADASQDTQLLYGEPVRVFYANRGGWAWVQSDWDGYVGWCPADALAMGQVPRPTHRVSALRAPIYSKPTIKEGARGFLSINATIVAQPTEGDPKDPNDEFLKTPRGFVWAGHLADAATHESDLVAVARRFVDLPYIWGGRASDGVDCSGLVQMAAMACGFDCPRDSDMQEDRFGTALAGTDVSVLEHGDLVFWKGHVGLVTQDQAGQGEMLLHANGYHMAVVEEPLAPALERIRTRSFGGVTRLRRPPRSKNDAGAR